MRNRIAALMLGVLVLLPGVAVAAEIKVLSTTAMASVLEALGPEFERATGHKVAMSFATAATLTKRIGEGEAADVVVLTSAGIADLSRQGKLAAGSRVDLARAGIGVAVRKGAPKPDISSPEALKRALLAAKSVAYTDPASGGASGVHFAKVLDSLGIASEVKAKARLAKGSAGELVGDIVGRGDAEIGVQQVPELMAASGIDIIGPLPGNLQSVTEIAAGLLASAREPEVGRTFLQFLTTPASAAVIKAKGLEPK